MILLKLNTQILKRFNVIKHAQKVLKKNFPDVPIYEDITKLDGKELAKVAGDIDLITGGFP